MDGKKKNAQAWNSGGARISGSKSERAINDRNSMKTGGHVYARQLGRIEDCKDWFTEESPNLLNTQS